MIAHRSQTDPHRLSATDQVLDGATLRDRFLTAFVLRNAGFFPVGNPSEAADCEWIVTCDSPSPSREGGWG